MFRILLVSLALVIFLSAGSAHASIFDILNPNQVGDRTTLPGTGINVCYSRCTTSHCDGPVGSARNGGTYWAYCATQPPPPSPPVPTTSSFPSFPTSIPGIGGFTGLIGGMAGEIITCDEGLWMPTVSPPVGGPKLFPWGARSYLYGPPSFPAQWLLGVTGPQVPCTISGEIIGYGDGIIFHGSSGGINTNSFLPTPPPPGPTSEEGCNNPTNNQHTRDALEKYGSNMLDGNVPGLENICPNYASFNREQRIGFWTQFINAVQKPESGCKNAAFGPEPDLSRPSQGLMQLSYGDGTCARNAGACSSISVSVDNAETAAGLTSTDSRRAINNPRNNLMCAVGIMDCLSTGGITTTSGGGTNFKGMDRYWSVLRDHRATDSVIRDIAGSYPGCR